MKRGLILLPLIFGFSACDKPPEGMDREMPRDPIIGCYESAPYRGQLIEIAEEEILFDGKVMHTRYEYGIDGRVLDPLIYAWPRNFLQLEDGKLGFGPIDEKGTATFEDGRTVIFERDKRGRYISASIIPNGPTLRFRKRPCP